MVAFFFEVGPRLGVPSMYKPGLYGHGGHLALSIGAVATLCINEQLEAVPGAGSALKSSDLEEQLRKSGPLWFAWQKTNKKGSSYGHAAVLIGVDDTVATFHDPEDEPKASMSIADLHSKLYKNLLGDSCMLRRKGTRSVIRGQVLPKIRALL
jgi:hypothetical protein